MVVERYNCGSKIKFGGKIIHSESADLAQGYTV